MFEMVINYQEFDSQWTPKLNNNSLPLAVAIPCYAEEDILPVLQSLDSAYPTERQVVVFLLINSSESDSGEVEELNEKALIAVSCAKFSQIQVVPIWVRDIPVKIAGVGLARRIAMDACARLYKKCGNLSDPILCLDADSTVDLNYFESIHRFFNYHQEMDAASIYFEHPIEENCDKELTDAITDYESHLRYFILAQCWADHPHAFHTVGSSMAVRAGSFLKQGGMNKRKAGEDFYFLHKFSKIGRLGIVNDTCVYPAARISDRVPFGTGRALLEMAEGKKWSTYSPETFFDLRKINHRIPLAFSIDSGEFLKHCPETFQAYAEIFDFGEKFSQIKKHAANKASFMKRFYQWWDAFQVFKYAHFCRDNFYPNQPVCKAVTSFFSGIGLEVPGDPIEQLRFLRKLDRDRAVDGNSSFS